MLNNNKGSMPLWISALGALSLMGIITGTQQVMQGFVASKADHHLKVKYDSATKWAINLGAYLITNNLVLCRKEVWDTTNNNKCKWNSSASNNPAYFQLSNESFSGGKLSYDLSTPDDVDFNLTEDIKVVFDLVDWGASGELKTVVGDIPGGVCRNDTTRVVDKTCPAVACDSTNPCTAPATCESSVCSCCGTGTTFEAISSLDQDYDVVIVEIIAGENTANQMKDYVGVRRPLSRLILNFEESPKCALKCDVGSAASSSASCRSALKTDKADHTTTVKVKIFNQGPGALYDLSLLREARERSKLKDPPPCAPPLNCACTNHSNCGTYQKCDIATGVCVGRKVVNLTDIVQNNTPRACTANADCTLYHSSSTCSSGTCVTIGAILPGDSFTFEDTIICENSSGSGDPGTYFPQWEIRKVMNKFIEINNDTTATDTMVYEMSQNVNVYSEKFMELEYRLDLTTPETAASLDTANIEPKRIFHHGNTIGLPDSISTAFMIYELPN